MAVNATDFLFEYFRGRKVLVTGASGFIGSYLCKLLIQLEANVETTSRRVLPPSPGVQQIHRIDLCDSAAVHGLVETIQPEYVFHLAAITSAARDISNVLPTLQANLVGTVNLLTAAARTSHCQRIILAGSLEEPDATGIAVPTSPYAASKIAGTLYARMFSSLYGAPATVARIFMAYGPTQPDRRKLIPYIALSLLKHEAPHLSSGTRLVDWVYVEDVVEALALAAVAQGLEGCTVDVGSGVLTSIRDVATCITHLVDNGTAPILGAVADRPVEQVCAANIERTRELLGHVPSMPLEEGLRRTVESYRRELGH